MTTRKFFMRATSILVISFFMITFGLAQEKGRDAGAKDDGITKMKDGSYRSKDHDESTRPDDSYLAKFHCDRRRSEADETEPR